MLKVKKLDPGAILPTKAHDGDLGYDLYALDNEVIFHGDVTLVRTGIACEFPNGYGALLRDRSSIVTKHGAAVVAGVIDNGYTGEILIAMHQIGKLSYHISRGQKIAQMILIPTVNFRVTEVNEIISSDLRGLRGFGSTDSLGPVNPPGSKCMCQWEIGGDGNRRRIGLKCLFCETTK